MINKAIIVGNLGRDPEVRQTKSGGSVTNFTVATTETWNDRDGNRQEQTEWHRVVAFGRLGEICGQYLGKGSKVYVEGRLQTRQWEDQSGATKYTTEIVAREMKMLDSRQAAAEQRRDGFTGGHSGGDDGGLEWSGSGSTFKDDEPPF